MSEELNYIKRRLDDLQLDFGRRFGEIQRDLHSISTKVDGYLKDAHIQGAKLENLKDRLEGHDRLLVTGNGQRSVTVQLNDVQNSTKSAIFQINEIRGQLKDLESKISGVTDSFDDTGKFQSVRVQKAKQLGKVGMFVALVISQVIQWFLGIQL